MAIEQARFESGMTYDQYKSQMTRNRERLEQNERQLVLEPTDLETLKSLPKPVNVLVLGEDWCGDVIANLPVLGRLAAASDGKLNVRIFLRDQNLDIMDQYLNQGKFRSIPVFVFFDEKMTELGHFIERPASVTARLAEWRTGLFAKHPEFGGPETPPDQLPEDVRVKLGQAMGQLRDELRPFSDREVIEYILETAALAKA